MPWPTSPVAASPKTLPRVLTDGISAQIDLTAWTLPPIFQWLQTQGNVAQADMLTTFNCGIGMVVVVPASHENAAVNCLHRLGETVFPIGELVVSAGKPQVIYR